MINWFKWALGIDVPLTKRSYVARVILWPLGVGLILGLWIWGIVWVRSPGTIFYVGYTTLVPTPPSRNGGVGMMIECWPAVVYMVVSPIWITYVCVNAFAHRYGSLPKRIERAN